MPFVLMTILWFAAVIYTVRAIFEREDLERNTQLLWTILIVLAPVVGLVIYYLYGEQGRR